MKDLYSFIIENKFINEANDEFFVVESEQMINESFKSNLLTRLAKKISETEKVYNKRVDDHNKNYSKKEPKHSFATILAPVDTQLKGENNSYRVTKSIKWSEISDSDFKEFDKCDKELKKIIQSTYGKKTAVGGALCIIATENDILNVVRTYTTKFAEASMYYFELNGGHFAGIKNIMKKRYSYQQRLLNANEAIKTVSDILDAIEDAKCYVLEITQDMIAEYSTLALDRKNAKEGTINYDEDSLKSLLKEQQSRYQALVKKMKADKGKNEVDEYMNKIKDINQQVVELTEKALKNPDYISHYTSVGDLMSTVSYLYQLIYDFVYHNKKSEETRTELKKTQPDKFNDEMFDKWDFDARGAQNSIKKLDDYIKKIKEDIEKIKKLVE